MKQRTYSLFFKKAEIVTDCPMFTDDTVYNTAIREYTDLLKDIICDIFYTRFHCVQLEYTTNENVFRDI